MEKKWREKYAKELKKRFGKKKTDYGDEYILSRAYDDKPRFFKEITLLDVEFKPLLIKERVLARVLQRLRWTQMLGIDVGDEIKGNEERLMRIRGEIVEKAMKKISRFTDIAEKLVLSDNDVNALLALAGLLIYLKWPYKVASMYKAIRYLGLYKPTKENIRKFEERSGERYLKGSQSTTININGPIVAGEIQGSRPRKGRPVLLVWRV